MTSFSANQVIFPAFGSFTHIPAALLLLSWTKSDHTQLHVQGLPSSLLAMQVGVLPVVHGSALAGQGQSQALVTATIGEADDQAKSEGITGHTSKQLMVQFGDRMAAAAEVSPVIAHET